MIIEYKGKKPIIGDHVFIAPSAAVIGDVEIGDGASIWFGAVIRGDVTRVRVGKNTNIQDNCTVHSDFDKPVAIGDNVTIGHNAVVHGCTIENNCLIGISAVVLNGAYVRKGSVIAASSVVKEGQEIGPYHLATGAPATVKKVLDETSTGKFDQPVKNYLHLSKEYMSMQSHSMLAYPAHTTQNQNSPVLSNHEDHEDNVGS